MLPERKKLAIIQLYNSISNTTIQDFSDLFDGKKLLPLVETLGWKTTKLLDDKKRIFEHLKEVIDEVYSSTQGPDLIKYESCLNGAELEVAKITLLLLTALVLQHHAADNSTIQTLTLLETSVQQDICDCLSYIIDSKQMVQAEFDKILLKPSRYHGHLRRKISVTPKVSDSMRTPSSDSGDIPMNDVLYSPFIKEKSVQQLNKSYLRVQRILNNEHDENTRLESENICLVAENEKLRKASEKNGKEINRLKDLMKSYKSDTSENREMNEEEVNEIENLKKQVEELDALKETCSKVQDDKLKLLDDYENMKNECDSLRKRFDKVNVDLMDLNAKYVEESHILEQEKVKNEDVQAQLKRALEEAIEEAKLYKQKYADISEANKSQNSTVIEDVEIVESAGNILECDKLKQELEQKEIEIRALKEKLESSEGVSDKADLQSQRKFHVVIFNEASPTKLLDDSKSQFDEESSESDEEQDELKQKLTRINNIVSVTCRRKHKIMRRRSTRRTKKQGESNDDSILGDTRKVLDELVNDVEVDSILSNGGGSVYESVSSHFKDRVDAHTKEVVETLSGSRLNTGEPSTVSAAKYKILYVESMKTIKGLNSYTHKLMEDLLKLKSERNRVDFASPSRARNEANMEVLHRRLREKEKYLTACEKKYSQLQSRYEAMKKKLGDEISKRDQKLKELEGNKTFKNLKLKSLTKKLVDCDSSMACLKADLKSKEEEIKKFKSELHNANKKVSLLKDRLREVKSRRIVQDSSTKISVSGDEDKKNNKRHLETVAANGKRSKLVSSKSNTTVEANRGASRQIHESSYTRKVERKNLIGLHTYDEEEFFNHSSIAELQHSSIETPTSRIMEIKRRNTLCPPHLKSSYPVETQALSTNYTVSDQSLRETEPPIADQLKNCATAEEAAGLIDTREYEIVKREYMYVCSPEICPVPEPNVRRTRETDDSQPTGSQNANSDIISPHSRSFLQKRKEFLMKLSNMERVSYRTDI